MQHDSEADDARAYHAERWTRATAAPGDKLDPAARVPMCAARRIARSLGRLAMIHRDPAFVIEADGMSAIMDLAKISLADWIASIGQASHSADFRAGTEGLREEAELLLLAMRGRPNEIGTLATWAERWASAVEGYCRVTAGLVL